MATSDIIIVGGGLAYFDGYHQGSGSWCACPFILISSCKKITLRMRARRHQWRGKYKR